MNKIKISKKPIYGCSNPSVLDHTLMCDGNCFTCIYQTITGYYKIAE